jgi:hypothetical protein
MATSLSVLVLKSDLCRLFRLDGAGHASQNHKGGTPRGLPRVPDTPEQQPSLLARSVMLL